MRRVIVQESDFDAAALQRALYEACAGRAGAIATFTGYVRDHAPDQATQTLYLEHYPGMCERELQEIGDAAMQRWDIGGYVILHRVGELPRHAQIVFVAAASAHRGEAFHACEYIMDALKTRAPFWKRETLTSGEQFWVQARDADFDKTRRWDDAPAAMPPADQEQEQ
ncbi:Molybdenum cofactor biosynthesis protein MoaE [plant metagenome]|uniref:Molybdenum cofactor biosynthesis protein MoaE n=1 Tax=plant metagenome TaxID=1297885 RepID=A0A484U4E5_9ZZZZ